MVKSIVTYVLVFIITGVSAYLLHNNFIEEKNIFLPFSLKKVYLFFVLFSLLICFLFKVGSVINKIKEQLGFIYLGTIIFKITVFTAVFYESVFTINLTNPQRIALIIPMAIFLFIEVFFVAKILNKTSF
ncbi:hypothetical protein BWZ20_09450 [Winogradskyella sp. J14-2]|uniref:DUF6168 family protein n=1 Tax=Winogradskyella sp. J14-2 TaxID=1936080 RepID=UPI000972CA9A|nr:DUF6168 family protein [Winogradskyella sp. J14-2]APY08511.1 hypothetical protein BWZ20_09450 [Winogradskyella sp. J14-2]